MIEMHYTQLIRLLTSEMMVSKLLTEDVIGVASAAKSVALLSLTRFCLLPLVYLIGNPLHSKPLPCISHSKPGLYLTARAFAMSTNHTSTSVSTNPTQVRQTASTRFSPLLHNGDSFRLLRVLPSLSHGSPIRCELNTASISRERNKYIAGSYVWGPPEPTMSILVDGGHFQVRENLFRFLKAFRSRYKTQVIWLDAICINQDDIQERSHQVQEMKRIYSGAKCVYSWLGYDKPMPHTGIFNRQYILDSYYLCIRDERQHKRRREQLEYILRADYWSRMWIVQEFLLAKKVQLLVGRNKLPYSKLKKILLDGALFDGRSETSQSQDKMIALITYRTGWRSLEALFGKFGMLPRSVPLDGVFALLGLLEGTEEDLRLTNIVDYSLTVWQLLQQILRLDILKSPFKFAEQYNRYVIKGQRDNYMGGHVGLKLMTTLPMQPRGADDSHYARTEGSSWEMAMGIRTVQRSGIYREVDAEAVQVAMYTSRWRSISGQSGVLVRLSQYPGTLTTSDSLYAHVLVEACDSRCATTCATHTVIGFSWTFTHKLEHTGHLVLTTSIDVPLLASYASGDVSRLILNIRQRSMEMVEAISSKVRMTANHDFNLYDSRTPYKLETDVETMVILSTFMKDLETHNGWQGLLALAMDLIRESGTEEDAPGPIVPLFRRKHVL